MDYNNLLKRFQLTNPLVIDYRQNVEAIARPAERDVEITYTRTALQSGVFSGLTGAEVDELRLYCLDNFSHVTYRVDAEYGTVVGNPVRDSIIVYPQITIEQNGALYNVTVTINETDSVSTASRQFFGFVCHTPITKTDVKNYMAAALHDAQITFDPFAGRAYLAYQSEDNYIPLIPKSVEWRVVDTDGNAGLWTGVDFSGAVYTRGIFADAGEAAYMGCLGREQYITMIQWRKNGVRIPKRDSANYPRMSTDTGWISAQIEIGGEYVFRGEWDSYASAYHRAFEFRLVF